jgi:hypothetical protein
MVSPVHGDYRRCQAEIPLIILCRFPGPALSSMSLKRYELHAARPEVAPKLRDKLIAAVLFEKEVAHE